MSEYTQLFKIQIALPDGGAIVVNRYGVTKWHAIELAYRDKYHEQPDRTKYRVARNSPKRKRQRK